MIELIVAIGILSVMMLLVGQIFDLTVQSTGEATALIEINQSLRVLENNLREDLEGVVAANSMLGIQGNYIDAYWTAAQREGDIVGGPGDGYPHEPDPERETLYGPNGGLLDGDEDINGSGAAPPYRLERPRADKLMFFTTRGTTSVVYPDVFSGLTMVVYGHAEVGELDAAGAWNPLALPVFPPRDSVAASWHLARRAIVIADSSEDDLDPSFGGAVDGLPHYPIAPQANVVSSSPHVTALIDGELDIIARDESLPIGVPPRGSCTLFFNRMVASTFMCGQPVPASFGTIEEQWMARSRMDLSPPPAQAWRLGHYFLPNCASFKVEWALPVNVTTNKNILIWVDPADIQNSVIKPLHDAAILDVADPLDLPMGAFQAGLGGRFDPTVVPPAASSDWTVGSTHVFLSADYDSVPPNADAPDPYFPKALRITVDMFDRAGKLVRPIRHVMVIPVGPQD